MAQESQADESESDTTTTATAQAASLANPADSADSNLPINPLDRLFHGHAVRQRVSIRSRIWLGIRWLIVILACAWVAFCTAVGPLYRKDKSITDFGTSNAIRGIITFAICVAIVALVVEASQAHSKMRVQIPRFIRNCSKHWKSFKVFYRKWESSRPGAEKREEKQKKRAEKRAVTRARKAEQLEKLAIAQRELRKKRQEQSGKIFNSLPQWIQTLYKTLHLRISRRLSYILHNWKYIITKTTNRWWKIAVLVGTVWAIFFFFVPTQFGADLFSQWREMRRWFTWIKGGHPSYANQYNIVDVYPIAHYLWPDKPTYVTNQHNVILTFLYGGAMDIAHQLTGAVDLGIIFMGLVQGLFALFCVSITCSRFFGYGRATRVYTKEREYESNKVAGPITRLLILVFFAFNPLALFSYASLTKSPLFAFAFLWWLGQWYEIFRKPKGTKLPKRLIIGLAISTTIMLISAKYASYIIIVHIALMLITDRRRWKSYLVALILPFIIFQGALTYAINSGAIINGDSMESRGIQLQQIARVMERNPSNVPKKAQKQLRKIFNLYAMGSSYFPDDADRVKSSGKDGKIETYKWETVTAEDMSHFNEAWLAVGKKNPVIYFDAAMAKVYGYFDVTDKPYVSVIYYLNTDKMEKTAFLQYWMRPIRMATLGIAYGISAVPVLGWLIHGNFYVVMCLLIVCAEFILKRWKQFICHFPLLLLMGVMLLAPANNFDRHMLPLAFVCGFMIIDMIKTARERISRSRRAHLM